MRLESESVNIDQNSQVDDCSRLRIRLAPTPVKLVGREGFEPSTIRLKVECSTPELPARSRRTFSGYPEMRRGP